MEKEEEEEIEPQQNHGAPCGSESEGGDEADGEESMESIRRDVSTEDELVKKLVRYALACEYSRTAIRREGIKEKGELMLSVLFWYSN